MSGLALTEYDICLSRQEHGAGQVRERGDRQKTGELPDPARPGATVPGRGCSQKSDRRPRDARIRIPACTGSRDIPGQLCDGKKRRRKKSDMDVVFVISVAGPCKRRISALAPVHLGVFLQTIAAHAVTGNSQCGRCVVSCCMGIHPGQLLRLFQSGKPFAKISIFLP